MRTLRELRMEDGEIAPNKCAPCDIEPGANIQQPTSNIEHPMPDIRISELALKRDERRLPFAMRAFSAFTLIEIMVVVAIMGVIMAISIPSVMMAMRQESVRKAAYDLKEACLTVRGRAIMSGATATLVFRPKDGTYSGGDGASGAFPKDVKVEAVGINWRDYTEEEEARVRFFANGTSDEMLVVFSAKGEYRSISLEVTTGLPDVNTDMRKMLGGK